MSVKRGGTKQTLAVKTTPSIWNVISSTYLLVCCFGWLLSFALIIKLVINNPFTPPSLNNLITSYSIFQNLITCLDDLVITRVGHPPLNTKHFFLMVRKKFKQKERTIIILIFTKAYN
jgi:hypothetical protein